MGLGRALHEGPVHPELGQARPWGRSSGPGLVVAVEPMLNLGEDETACHARMAGPW